MHFLTTPSPHPLDSSLDGNWRHVEQQCKSSSESQVVKYLQGLWGRLGVTDVVEEGVKVYSRIKKRVT